MHHLPAPERSLAAAPPHPEYFEGRVRLQPLLSEQHSTELELVAVFFEDGARTIPHTHATDQLLWVVEGTCLVVDETGRREVEAGGSVLLPAHRWHWHGAAPGRSACHVSIRRPGPTDWTVPRRDW
jgi:quercetin dioxygenase-like cupin family protein